MLKHFTKRAKGTRAILFAVVLVLLWVGVAAASDGKHPKAGLKPLDENRQMQVSHGDHCPVCGMNSIQYPKFNCAIQLKNTDTYYFCSVGCMIRSWMHPEIYLGTPGDMLERPIVREYFSGRQMDARDTIFVYGSDVIGPMGPALVPVLDERHLKVFKKRHGGKTQVLLEDLNDAKWYEMTGRKMAE
ncbi:putative NosL protein [Desulforapulum autotrophicum HRM2]|uniref:NosL protein n=1 Tax=Desulforapulum autotrophicum (strain ATCC 43914 / DSM 3382 / VKM B-1955 / HRM2) TaxID=177437 RepID=C0Q9J4_DESAH|nr:nitrous oxide reductase accessory protein NosL [Desulforapulum autotrophicum]ACN14558.1 putative NosL protein [Desulforapulum autotrophicum HRM2]